MNFEIIRVPIVTEKSMSTIERGNCYVFEVLSSSTKPMIKKAVESIFNVKVKSVNVLNQSGKRKVFKSIHGKRKDFKKAYVRLVGDSKIDLNVQQ
jgi:large subunit ribosomal protein L23